MNLKSDELTAFLVGFGTLLPMFFTLNGGLYRSTSTMTDSGGVLANLPLPVSILTCLLVLLLHFDKWDQPRIAWRMIAATIGVLLISLWLGGDGLTSPARKVLASAQVLLPLIGLLVGQLVARSRIGLPLSFLTVLTLIVPAQLYFTYANLEWGSDANLTYQKNLTDQLHLFTVYSHLQYVPLVFVGAYAIALGSLWKMQKVWLSIFSLLFLVYVLRSYSYLSVTAFVLVAGAFLIPRLNTTFLAHRTVATRVAAALLAGTLLLYLGGSLRPLGFVESSVDILFEKYAPIFDGKIPPNVQERFDDWQFFSRHIMESSTTIMFGHPEPMPREIRTSPHNWYLDIAHTFGVIALLPILFLIAYTIKLTWVLRSGISSETWWLVGVVAFFVLIDSNFKVTLRQPYPGIFIFFLWGMLFKQFESLQQGRQGLS